MRMTTTVVMVITTASMMVSMMSMAMIIIVDVAVATVGVEMREPDVTRPASSCAASEGGGGAAGLSPLLAASASASSMAAPVEPTLLLGRPHHDAVLRGDPVHQRVTAEDRGAGERHGYLQAGQHQQEAHRRA